MVLHLDATSPKPAAIWSVLGLLGATSLMPTTDPFVDAMLFVIKILASVAGALLIWYTNRLMKKLEKALDFVEKAPEKFQEHPESFWRRFTQIDLGLKRKAGDITSQDFE